MGALAAALMIWYYSGAIHRNARAQELAEAATKRRAQGESTLPSLGVIQPPRVPPPAQPPPTQDSALDAVLGPPPPIPVTAPEIPMANANPYAQAAPAPKTPEELELERRLGGRSSRRRPIGHRLRRQRRTVKRTMVAGVSMGGRRFRRQRGFKGKPWSGR